MKYCEEDYDVLAWELQQVCSFLRGLGLDDMQIGDFVINGDNQQRGYAYDIVYGLAEVGFKEKLATMDSLDITEYIYDL